MQFQVPQFIEVEDKIFGPLTFKQFVYIGGGVGACYILWRVLPIYLAGPLIAVIGGLAASLAFFQFNGRPFIIGLENGFFFFVRSKLYLWNNARGKNVVPPVVGKLNDAQAQVYVPTLSGSKLHEMAWSLDIKERIAQGVENDKQSNIFKTDRDMVVPMRTPQQAVVRLTGDDR